MDLRKLKTLIDLISESNISELEITEADGTVRIVKSPPPAAPQMVAYAPAPMAPAAPMAVAAPLPAAPVAAPVEKGHVVKSPMVGTFYRSSTPGGAPLVDAGQTVKQGQAVCIIEAMKIMNEIETDFAGTVVKVLIENGAAVEYGQPLFVIE